MIVGWLAVRRRRQRAERLAFERSLAETQKYESIGLLAGGIAHDFNNLLAVVQGSADHALLHCEAASPAAESMRRVASAAQRASELTQQLLAYSGRGSLEAQPLDLNDLVRDMGSLLEASVGKGVRLVYRVDPHLPAVEADVGRLRQVVLNLIVNASEAIGEAGGEITLATGWSEESDGPDAGRWVWLSVGDDGCGMPDETLPHIFDPFFTSKREGRGLGLAAAHGIVRAHGGRIHVESTVGGGSTFTVYLPASDRNVPVPDEPRQRNMKLSGRLLVVDDEEHLRATLRVLLQTLGFDVVCAESGEEAIDVFEKSADEIVCTLLDLTMPGMSGERTLSALRRIRPDAPVILMSGYRESPGGREPATRYLQKPFRAEELEEVLAELVSG